MDPGSIISAVHLSLQLGQLLIETCQHFKRAEAELQELWIRVHGSWIRIKQQLQFIERIASTLGDEHRRFQDDILSVLATKLSLAQSSIEKVLKKTEGQQPVISVSKIRRVKYIMQRGAINKVVSDLEIWQSRFDPSWFLIMRIDNPVIDQQLASQKAEEDREQGDGQGDGRVIKQSPISLATGVRDALRADPRRHISVFLPMLDTHGPDIPYSNAKTTQIGGSWFLIERYNCQTGRTLSAQNHDVRRLARKLASVDPLTFGLLNCKGVIKILDQRRSEIKSFDFVFRVPEHMEVIQSLRQNLMSGELYYSLSRRMVMAKELAKSVGYVHNLNFVHKHICPETILLFQDLGTKFSTYLIGFDNFRAADGGTNFAGDSRWERNLYRHPSRQGEFPEEAYRMQHDVYSLGVCLLEIGLWESFVSYTSDPHPKPRYGNTYQQFTTWLENTSAAEAAPPRPSNPAAYQKFIAAKLKDYFVHLAKTKLPIVMGDRYAEVVVTCLTCLDENNDDFGDETDMDDEGGILVAVRFMEVILQRLNEIVV